MKYIFSFLLVFVVGFATSFGQKVTYYGEIIDLETERSINGVTVRVLHNGAEVASSTTSGGKYSVQFDPGKVYTVEYIKSGYVSKIISVDVTKVNVEDMPPGGKIFPPIKIDLFTERPGADFSFLKTEPVVQWFFDRDRMNYDARQASSVKKKISDKLKEAEDAAKNTEAEYNALIQEADQLFNNKQYESALDKYVAALKVPGKDKEKHPSNRIIEIGDILQKKAEEDLEFKQENQAYFNLIEAADNFASKKEYSKAIAKYEEAIDLKSDEQYPYDRVKDLKEILANEKKREEYDKLIVRADGFFNQNSLQAARDAYQEASDLLRNEQYPKDQLAIISGELDAQSEVRAKKEKYRLAIEAADKHFNKEEFEEAIDKYREAISFESAASYPVERISMAETRMAEIQAVKLKQENFDRLVQEGNDNVGEKKYEVAITKYSEALALIDNPEVKALRDNAQQLLAQQKANAEQQAAFDALVKAGDEQVVAKGYEVAITKYNEALALIDDAEVKTKRDNAQQLLTVQQANAEKQGAFDALVKAGDEQVVAKSYETALSKYNEALALIDDAEVKTKRDNAQQLLAQQKANAEQQAAFDALVQAGDESVSSKNYEIAISRYNEALALMDNAGVKTKRDNAQKLLTENQAEAEKKNAFNLLVEQGDVNVNTKNYEQAIAKYNEALALINDDNVKVKRDGAQQSLLAQQKNAAQEAEIANLLSKASAKMGTQNYTGAIADYTAVLTLDTQNAEAIEGKGNAERLLAEEKGNEEKEKQFKDLVTKADLAFANKNWEDAKTNYMAAKAIFSDRSHVNNRIEEIQTILNKIADKKRIDEEIQVLLDQAANLKMNNNWGQVIQKYEEALSLDNQRSDIEVLLSQARKSQADWDAAQSQDELFAQLKKDGETFMASQKWTDAKAKFEAALKINTDAEITANLALIEQKIAEELQNQAKEASYQAKMKAGEDFASGEQYEQALASFNEALIIKENDAVAMSRIADMQQKIAGLGKQAEKEERYNAAMTSGKEAMSNSDYAAAIKFFDDALLAKPVDSEANRLLAEAKTKIKALQSEEEKYESFLAEGATLLSNAKTNNNHIPTLEASKALYREAQKMRPEASLPQSKIVEIDNLLRQIEEEKAEQNLEAEINRRYQEKIDLATIAAQGKNYQNAIDHLKEANQIKPNEQYPKDKIKEYKEQLALLAGQSAVETQYANLIDKADLAFDNRQYEKSIGLYNEALAVKQNEAYPMGQIAKAEKAIEDAKNNTIEQQYQSFIIKGDQNFANKDYAIALSSYESALEVKEQDTYARDKVDEIKQILKNLKNREAEDIANKARYDAFIKEADDLFNNTRFIDAKKIYDKAIEVMPNDIYAIERSQLSVVRSKEKTEKEGDALYHKVVEKADEYFDAGDYDKARGLYERALSLRSYDRYPQDKIDEILALQNANVKTNSEIEYLGEKVNISIVEGAALLAEGDRQREQMKRTSIDQHLRKNEGVAEDLSARDLIERHAYENEIVAIRDKRDNLYIDEQEKHQIFVDYIDELVETLDKHQQQIYDFKYGEVTRTYRNVEYIETEFDETKLKYNEDHQDIVDKIDLLEKGREAQTRAEMAHHKVGVVATSEELLKTEIKNEDHYELSLVKQKDLAVKVDDIIKGREVRTFEESNDLYEKIIQLEGDALLAEIRVSDAKDDKLAINKQLEQDIYALDAALQRKRDLETDEAYDLQLEIDGQLLAASNHYQETIDGKDEARQVIVERVKDLEAKQADQAVLRADKHYQETQNINVEAENILTQRDEQVIKQGKDLAAIDREVKAQVEAFDRADRLRNEAETDQRHRTVDELERIRKQEELLKEESAEVAKDNYESVKGLSASIEGSEEVRRDLLKKDAYRTQELVNQLENNKLTYSPLIANTIGDEYPEGVSQENYVRKDDKGLPVQIVTRRFVVTEGHGDIYIRIQTRNGITYSKNGNPITEQGWINGTENANLAKHF